MITVPLIVLSVFAILAGFLNAAAIHVEKFAEWVEPRVSFPELVHPEFDYPTAVISLSVAALGIGIAAYFWFKREELGALKGLTAAEQARARRVHVPREQVLPRRALREHHRGVDQGRHGRRRRTG